MSISVLKGKKVLITAGPTREAIDPVRYISNHSSGKMGYAIAEEFLKYGAKVILISGPVNLQLKHTNLKLIPVHSAFEMYVACSFHFEGVDIAVFSAAVADYKPLVVADKKLKKTGEDLIIHLVRNPDIAFEFGIFKKVNQLSVGFALETNNELKYAKEKLQNKNFDMIILNSMNDAQATFEYDTNKVTIIHKDLEIKRYPVKHKTEVASDIIKEISGVIMKKQFTLEKMPFGDS